MNNPRIPNANGYLNTKFSAFEESHLYMLGVKKKPHKLAYLARENAMSGRHFEVKKGKIDRACHRSIMDGVIRQTGHKC